MLIRRAIQLPLNCREINRKVEAWRELFGTEPVVTISGYVRADDHRMVRAKNSEVTHIGRKYLTTRLNGQFMKLDPASCDPAHLCYLYLEDTA